MGKFRRPQLRARIEQTHKAEPPKKKEDKDKPKKKDKENG